MSSNNKLSNNIPDLYVVCFIVVRVQFHSLKSFRFIFINKKG